MIHSLVFIAGLSAEVASDYLISDICVHNTHTSKFVGGLGPDRENALMMLNWWANINRRRDDSERLSIPSFENWVGCKFRGRGHYNYQGINSLKGVINSKGIHFDRWQIIFVLSQDSRISIKILLNGHKFWFVSDFLGSWLRNKTSEFLVGIWFIIIFQFRFG